MLNGISGTYGGDAFTSDLRWAILVIACIVGFMIVGFAMLGLIAVAAHWPAKSEEQKRLRNKVIRRPYWHLLPQDECVKIVSVPYDQDEGQVFDYDEWEKRVGI